jgi:hypothetical protein
MKMSDLMANVKAMKPREDSLVVDGSAKENGAAK